MNELLEALKPILRAVEVNDGDTISRLDPDSKVLWTATGSWSGAAPITLGDLRRIAKTVKAGENSR